MFVCIKAVSGIVTGFLSVNISNVNAFLGQIKNVVM